jgi:Zn-dependent protease with chaperone function
MSRLLLASVIVITALFGLVFAVGMLVLLKLQIPPGLLLPISAAFSVGVVLLQYFAGPYLIDIVVQIRWTTPAELGPDFDQWLRKTCATFRIPSPRFGIIEEGSPNAFTYGNGPWNARVVVTRGVIDALDPEELKAVVAHELGHIRNRDFIVMTIVQALVLALYSLYIASRYSRRGGAYVVLLSFVAYQLSYYISLYLSRIREYMADFASGQIMTSGNTLSSALVKIAYGMGKFHAGSPGVPAPVASGPSPYPRSPYGTGGFQGGSYAAPPSSSPGMQKIVLPPPVMPNQPPVMPPVMSQPMSSDRVTPELLGKLNAIQTASDKRNGIAAPVKNPKSQPKFSAQNLGAFGIASAASMRAAVAWGGTGGTIDPSHFTNGARWELYNPWGRIAELVSTHPLTARRIQALQKMNKRWNVPDAFDFSKVQPGHYSGFLADVVVVGLPFIGAAIGAGLAWLGAGRREVDLYLMPLLCGLGGYCVGNFIQLLLKYRGSFLRANVIRCLSELNVSHVRPVPVVIQGMFTGRLSAGIPWADDYVLQDDSGFVACILHQPFRFFEWIWGWMYSQRFVGQEVLVYGWYRRFGSPFIEISHFQVVSTRETIRSYYYPAALAFSALGAVLCGALAMLVAR